MANLSEKGLISGLHSSLPKNVYETVDDQLYSGPRQGSLYKCPQHEALSLSVPDLVIKAFTEHDMVSGVGFTT